MSFAADEKLYQDSILQDLQEKAAFSDYEVALVKDIVTSIEEPLPNTLSGSQNKVSALDSFRPKLINLLYVVNKKYIKAERAYNSRYYSEFARLNKITKSSKDAIEAEVMAKGDLLEYKEALSYIEQVKWLLTGYLRSLDQSRDSNIKRWADNKRMA